MANELEFPVVAHHRIIVKAELRDDSAMQCLFEDFDLIEPVAQTNASAGGKYMSYGLSVRLKDRGEMERLDERIKIVPGLKMVL